MAEIYQWKSKSRHQIVQTPAIDLTLDSYLTGSVSGKEVKRYMSAFPHFARMVRLLDEHVGFDVMIAGRSLFASSLESAVKAADELAEERSVENTDVSDMLVMTLVQSIAQLRDWKVFVESDEDEDQWDITANAFGDWFESTNSIQFRVEKQRVQASEVEKRGLSIRLMCFALSDEPIGRIASTL